MRTLDIGIVTDEVALDPDEALSWCRDHGIARIELRNATEGRFPNFTDAEMNRLEEAVRAGVVDVTAVSPGILKGPADAAARIDHELEETLPCALELASRLSCQQVVVFGFEHYDGEPDDNRARAQETLARCAERCQDGGAEAIVENEPGFWINLPQDEAELLEEIGHPALGANWDPANAARGGHIVDRADFEAIRPHMRNLHVKDRNPGSDVERPVPGEGVVPWEDILSWVAADTDLPGVTLEPSVSPDPPLSERCLEALREILRDLPTR